MRAHKYQINNPKLAGIYTRSFTYRNAQSNLRSSLFGQIQRRPPKANGNQPVQEGTSDSSEMEGVNGP